MLRGLLVVSLLVVTTAGLSFARQAQQPRVLVFSKTAGFRHSSIETGIALVKKIGAEQGFAVDATEDASAFNDANLRKYRAIVFMSTTGDVLDAVQQDALERYIQAGGGWVGVHSATDTEYDWPWYGKLAGAWFKSHPLNPNVRKVRDDQEVYLQNILKQAHGSVLEHVSFSFVLHNVSRVFTHEIARHRPGTAISQESLRYVRLDELPFWFPDWAQEDPELMKRATALLTELEQFQQWLAGHFGLDEDETKMHEKKAKTSFMRRFAPEGLATGLVWTANVRTLRHTLEARTDQGAEEEIRLVFGKIGELMRAEAPALFGDYTVTEDGTWIPGWRKV